MIYAYIGVPTDKQTLENQKSDIKKFADKNKFQIDNWVEEHTSFQTKLGERKIDRLFKELKSKDILIISELSFITKNLNEVMQIVQYCIEKDIKLYTVNEDRCWGLKFL